MTIAIMTIGAPMLFLLWTIGCELKRIADNLERKTED